MKRMRCWLAALLGPLLATALAVAALGGGVGRVPEHSVPEVLAGLARDPQAWLGRTVRPRGIALPVHVYGHRHPLDLRRVE
jgi:hypothetical protein